MITELLCGMQSWVDVDVDDAIEDLNTRYNEAYDADIESGSVKRLVIEDYDPLHPSDGTATYLDK